MFVQGFGTFFSFNLADCAQKIVFGQGLIQFPWWITCEDCCLCKEVPHFCKKCIIVYDDNGVSQGRRKGEGKSRVGDVASSQSKDFASVV
jgi:hypothetical protein